MGRLLLSPLKPSVLQGEQALLHQPLLIGQVLPSTDHPGDPILNLLQFTLIFLVLRGQNWSPCSRSDLTSAEESNCLDLHSCWYPWHAAWLPFSLLNTRTSPPFQHSWWPDSYSPTGNWCRGSVQSRFRTLQLSLLSVMKFMLTYSFSLSRSR